jgi:hypothetical protein
MRTGPNDCIPVATVIKLPAATDGRHPSIDSQSAPWHCDTTASGPSPSASNCVDAPSATVATTPMPRCQRVSLPGENSHSSSSEAHASSSTAMPPSPSVARQVTIPDGLTRMTCSSNALVAVT